MSRPARLATAAAIALGMLVVPVASASADSASKYVSKYHAPIVRVR